MAWEVTKNIMISLVAIIMIIWSGFVVAKFGNLLEKMNKNLSLIMKRLDIKEEPEEESQDDSDK